MIDFAGLTLLRPWWLLAVPAIAALAVLAARRERRSGWASVIDHRLTGHLQALGFVRSAGRDRAVLLVALAAGLAAVALAGPATQRATAPSLRSLDTLVVAVDMSRSMTEGGAMETVRAATARLLAGAGARPVALILFAGDAYLASAPADDAHLLETLVSVLGPDTMPDAGSRPDKALTLAAEVLRPAEGDAAEPRRRDVVLVSDGGGLGPETRSAAEALAARDITLSAVFVPPTERPYGMPQPQPDALAALASEGGGWMARADAVQGLADSLAAAARPTIPREIAALMYEDHGRTVLIFALLPAIFLFRRTR